MQYKKILTGICLCALVLYLGACGGDSGGSQSTAEGKAVYNKYCALCHGEDGKREANGAKDITVSVMPLKDRVALIRTGKNLMTPFEGILTPDQMEAAAKHSMTLK